MSQNLLVVDDDVNISEILEFNLKNEGYEVLCATSAEEAFPLIEANDFNLILLDVMMGGMSGFKMAEKLHQAGCRIPIIFLTAKNSENDMLTGFSVGGDDYIMKPFSVKEVIARVKAVLNRSLAQSQAIRERSTLTLIECEGFIIDLELKEVSIDGEILMLTKTEYGILALLASHPERTFSRDEIIDIVWHETPYVTERTVDVHITRLRKKMGRFASLLTNRSGYGYRLKI